MRELFKSTVGVTDGCGELGKRAMKTMRSQRLAADDGGDQRARRRAAHDGGFSLVEVVITITLIALVIIPIIQATMVGVKASSTARLATTPTCCTHVGSGWADWASCRRSR